MKQSSEEYLLSLLVNKSYHKQMRETFIQQRTSPFLKFEREGLVVKYIGKGLVYTDITSVQANQPVPKDTFIYYYEVLVHNLGPRGDMCIGLAEQDFPVNKHPGSTSKSIGYRCDGKIFIGKQETELKMPTYKTGDVIGCGINFLKKEIFFTKDGQVLSIETHIPMFSLQYIYPTVSLHAQNQQLVFNFGTEQFNFDIESYSKIEKAQGVEKILEQPVSSYDVHKVVQEYLWRQGHIFTLNAFNQEAYLGEDIMSKECSINKVDNMEFEIEEQKQMEQEDQFNSPKPKTPKSVVKNSSRKISGFEQSPNYMVFMRKESALSFEDFSINQELPKNNPLNGVADNSQKNFDQERLEHKKFILEGDIESLIKILLENSQEVLHARPDLLPLLHAQAFIERSNHCVQQTQIVNKNELVSAIQYAQTHLTKYENAIFHKYDKNGKIEDITIDSLMGILCYTKPEESSLGDLLSQKQRELVADVLNKAMLKSQNCEEDSSLEIVIKQLKQIGDRLKQEDFYQGEIFEFKV